MEPLSRELQTLPDPKKPESAPLAPSPGFWRDAARRFRRNRPAFAALIFVMLAGLAALLAPFIAGKRPILCKYKGEFYFPFLEYYYEGALNSVFLRDGFFGVFPVNLKAKDPSSWAIWPLLYKDPHEKVDSGEWEGDPGDESGAPPSWRNLCGTDDLGRDIFSRILYGTQIALLVGLLSMGIAGAIGISLGALAGYCGGWVDLAISRAIELLLCVPTLVLILALLSIIERPHMGYLIAVIGFTRWESIARYTRAEILRLKSADFVTAARALGAPWHRILFRHMLPNALAPAIVAITFGIGNAVLVESALSYLGFGTSRSTPSWGRILDSWNSNPKGWWLAVFPGSAIFLTVLAYNLIGDGIREATDPRERR